MAYFASYNAVTTEDKHDDPDWVEISAEYYSLAIEALSTGQEIIVSDNLIFRDKQPSKNHEWINDEWVLMPPEEPEPLPLTDADVDAERDRRIANGFIFEDVYYQSRQDDRENIAGASTAALGAIVAGAQIGNLRWHGGDSDFVWIAADNSTHTMDAQTMFAFGQTAMAHKIGRAHV